jgi:lysophospholipase L1-like esterase
MNRTQRLWLLIHLVAILLIVVIAAARVFMSGAQSLQTTVGSAQVSFMIDRQTLVAPGDCAQAAWQVEGVREVYINDIPTVGQGAMRLCPDGITPPTLRIVLPDGSTHRYPLFVDFFIAQPTTYFLIIVLLALVGSAAIGGLLRASPARTIPTERASTALLSAGCGARAFHLIGVIGVIIVLSVISLELLMRLIFSTVGTQAQRISYVYSREQIEALDPYILALPLIEYGLSPARDGHNQLGYRGREIALPKPDDVFRIVAMGGSTTYGFTAVDESYPAWLERTLREQYGYEQIEVINAGVHGYTSWNTLVNFALRIVELDPDLVIIYDSTNDVLPREVAPDCYRGQNPLRGLDPRGQIATNTINNSLSPSVLYRFITIHLGLERDPSLLDAANTTARIDCGGLDINRAANVAQNAPVFFERNLTQVIALARWHNIRLVFGTWGYYEASSEPTDYWRAAVSEHNALIRNLAADYDIPLIDYAPLAPQDPAVWSDYIHMNGVGSQHQGETFAAFIAEQGWIESAS